MDEYLLVDGLRPVDVNGFQVSLGFHSGDILIAREGRKCKHYFVSRDRIKNASDYEKVIKEALSDFIKTAKIGGGQREDYVRDYCCGESKKDISAAWRNYRSAYIKLTKLLGCSPLEFLGNNSLNT